MENRNIRLLLEDFSRLEITGVKEVLAFDDTHVELILEENLFLVGGLDLQIESFSRETGQVLISGKIHSFFKEEEPVKKPGILSKLFS